MTVDDLRNYPCPGTLILKVTVNGEDKSIEIVGLKKDVGWIREEQKEMKEDIKEVKGDIKLILQAVQ